jgi:hypothetical protein
MRTSLRRFVLTMHVVASVGWLGAATCVLALGIAGLTGATAMYQGTEVVWRSVIIPFSIAALVTGVVQALATQWGLFRHYWVLTKLMITAVAVLLLLLHTRSLLPALVHAAIDGSAIVVNGHAHGHGGVPPRVHLVIAAGGTLLLLLITTMLSVYKPWGRTPVGRRVGENEGS